MTISLSKYMEEHIDWIESKFTERSVRRIVALFSSLLTIPQLSILSRVSYACHAHRKDRSLGNRRQHFVRSRQRCVV
jgi:hypothetical protein